MAWVGLRPAVAAACLNVSSRVCCSREKCLICRVVKHHRRAHSFLLWKEFGLIRDALNRLIRATQEMLRPGATHRQASQSLQFLTQVFIAVSSLH